LNSDQRAVDHFVEITEMIGIGKGGQRAVKIRRRLQGGYQQYDVGARLLLDYERRALGMMQPRWGWGKIGNGYPG